MKPRQKMSESELQFRRDCAFLRGLGDERLLEYLRDLHGAEWGLGQNVAEIARTLLWNEVRELIRTGVIQRRKPRHLGGRP